GNHGAGWLAGFATFLAVLLHKPFDAAIIGTLMINSGVSGRPGTERWVTPHLLGGLGLAAAIAWCFQAQVPQIRRQHALIEEVMAEVRESRRRRGLDVES
ncbi:MAG: hypothetical protein ACKOHG_03840, partial [Planctomycetia bacterium]